MKMLKFKLGDMVEINCEYPKRNFIGKIDYTDSISKLYGVKECNLFLYREDFLRRYNKWRKITI